MTSQSNGVISVDDCRLQVVAGHWPYAVSNAVAIDHYWARRREENPAMFNGQIFVMAEYALHDRVFDGRLLRTDFKSYLHWREHGFSGSDVRDAFGSALLRSAEGHVVLGRQRPGYVNGGRAYLPGGFIDHRDVTPSGTIDIAASIARELAEETGLKADDLAVGHGFRMTFAGPLVSVAREYRSSLPAADLVELIRSHIAADEDPELDDVVVVECRDDLERHDISPYARTLLSTLLPRDS